MSSELLEFVKILGAGLLEFVTIVGAGLGIFTFGWKILDVLSSYLYIDIDVGERSEHYQIIKTKVENKSKKSKKIDNALLLIGPEQEKPGETYNKLMELGKKRYRAENTNEIAEKKLEKQIVDNEGRIVMPLPFYYSENLQIGDEAVNYYAPINTKNMQEGTPYSARFFIGVKGRYHRSTQACFIKQIDRIRT